MADFLLSVGVDVGLSYDQMQKDISNLISQLNSNPPKIKVGLDIDNAAIENFRTQIAEISKSLGGIGGITTTSDTASNASSATTSMADLASKTREAASATTAKASATKTDNAEELKRQSLLKRSYTLLTQMQNAEIKWTAAKSGKSASSYTAIQSDIAALQQWNMQFKSGQITPDEFAVKLSNLSSSFTTNSNTIKAAGEATHTWGQRLGTLSAKFGTWFSITRVIMAAYRAVRQMVTNVIELDTAMTELKKVTDETDATYEKFLVRATSRAKELGAALSDTVNATADFARLGYGIEDAEKLADAAIVYKNVGDGIEDISNASESIISTMQAFNIPAEQVMSIVDRFNEVGNNFAISSKGVGDALLRSASALHAANNTLDESIALATAANSVVQDPEKVGTALKTLSMFLRAAKTEAEDAGESTDGMANSVSELRDEILRLTGNKVDIQINENTFKSTYQIIKELSAEWQNISDLSQANILELIGGKRNSNIVSALLNNFQTAEDALRTSSDATGSALRENEKVLDSIQGKINIMKASFESLSSILADSDIIKSVIDSITMVLNVLTEIGESVKFIFGLIGSFPVQLIIITKMLSSIYSLSKSTLVINRLNHLSNGFKTVCSYMSALTQMSKLYEYYMLRVSGATTQASLAQTGLSASTVIASKKILELISSPLGKIGLLVAAIGILTKGYDSLISRRERLADTKLESIDKDISELDDEIQTLEVLQDQLKSARGNKEELAKIQGELNNVIGNTPGLLNGEADAYQNATTKLKAYIKAKELEREAAQQDKVDNSKIKFDNNAYKISRFGLDWIAPDLTGKQMRTLAKEYQEYINEFDSFSEDNPYKKLYKSAEDYAKDWMSAIWEMNDITPEAWADYWDDQVGVAYDVFAATIDSYEGYGGQDFLKNLIANMVRGGSGLKEIETAIKSFVEDSDIQKIIEDYWSSLSDPNIDSEKILDNIRAKFNEFIELYPELKGFFDGVFNRIQVGSNETSEAIDDTITKIEVSQSDLESASDKVGKLSSAFKELSDDGYITTKTLGEIQEATGLSGDEWVRYQAKLIGAKVGSSEFNQIMGELTYKMLDNALAGRDLNNVTEEEIALLLKENGVSNSTAVAHDYLTRAKLSAKIATIDWNNATEEQIQSLRVMAQECGITAQGMDILTQTMSILSNTDLNLADKCSALLEMAAAAGIAAASIGTASYAISEIKKGSVAGFHMLDSGGKSLDTLYESSIDEVIKTIFNKYSNLSVGVKTPKYTSKSSKSKGSNKSDTSPFDDSYYSTVEAQIADDEKKIKALEKDREALNAKFEHAMDVGNKEQAEILRTKLSENVKAQKDILAGQNILNRGVQTELLNSLYELAPTLSGKSWDEISEVELTELENSLNKASELASDDDSKNNSKLALNKFKGIVSDLKALDDAMKENSEAWQKLDEDSKGYWQSQIDFQEDYSKSWIDNQKSFDRMRDDEELAAYRRMIENNKNFQKQILNDISLSEEAKLALIKETNDKISEYENESYELEKKIVSDILNLSKSRIESTKSILQSHYDITNSIAEAQHEINKELKASKTMYEWLDENTRKLLFNQEDYNILSDKLVDIQGEAEKLQRRYNQEVLDSTASNLDAITSKYQMQYETLMKTYEIAKAELEVAKKRQQLDNVLNERNVRMLIDGKWRWVANTQDVINAQNELADAEYQAQQAKLEKNQTNSLNNLTKATDRLTTITNQISDGEINIRDITGNISSSLGGIATKSVPALKSIIDETKDALRNLTSDISGGKPSNAQSYSAKSGSLSKTNATATIPGVGTVGVHINDSGKTTTKGLPVGTVVHTSGGDYKITGSDNDNYTSIKVKNAYANGTNHTKPGTALMGEEDFEVFIDKNGHLIPVEQPTIFKDIEAGGKVFNAMQMKNLDSLWNLSNIGLNPNKLLSLIGKTQSFSGGDSIAHYHGDIIIHNPVDFNDFTQKLTKAIKMRAPITKNMPR